MGLTEKIIIHDSCSFWAENFGRSLERQGGPTRGSKVFNTIFFFPPVWPIRTRHGPYNSVSGEKHLEKGLVWSKNAGKSSHQHKQKTKQKRNQNDPQIPQPDLRFAIKQTAKQQRTGPGPNKNQTKQLEICLEYSDLSHCIVIKNMQTN